MKKTLSMGQIKAAQLLAKGWSKADIARQVGVKESTIYRWLKDESFSEAVTFLQKEQLNQAAILAESTSADDLDQSRLDEIELREAVRPLALNTIGLAAGLIERIETSEDESLPARMLPQLIGAAQTAVGLLRTSNDRLTGLEALLDELSQIDTAVSAAALNIANGGTGEGG